MEVCGSVRNTVLLFCFLDFLSGFYGFVVLHDLRGISPNLHILSILFSLLLIIGFLFPLLGLYATLKHQISLLQLYFWWSCWALIFNSGLYFTQIYEIDQDCLFIAQNINPPLSTESRQIFLQQCNKYSFIIGMFIFSINIIARVYMIFVLHLYIGELEAKQLNGVTFHYPESQKLTKADPYEPHPPSRSRYFHQKDADLPWRHLPTVPIKSSPEHYLYDSEPLPPSPIPSIHSDSDGSRGGVDIEVPLETNITASGPNSNSHSSLWKVKDKRHEKR